MSSVYIKNINGGVVTAASVATNAQIAVLNQGSADLQRWSLTSDGCIVLNPSSSALCLSVPNNSSQPLQNGSQVILAPSGAPGYLQSWRYDSAAKIFALQTENRYVLTSGSGGASGPTVYVSTDSASSQSQWVLDYNWVLEQEFDFSTAADVDRTVWQSPQWISDSDNPAFFGRTSIRNPTDFPPPLPGDVPVVANAAQLCLSTFNQLALNQGNPPDFLGAQIGTIDKWGLQSYEAVAFESQVMMPISGTGAAPAGVVASLFAYNLIQVNPFLHDEIDFEISSNFWASTQPQINTNVYVVTGQNMPNYDNVVTSSIGLSGTVTLRIEWSQAGVSWYINKDQNPFPIHTEANVPQSDMSLVLNFWVPDSGWGWAYNGTLQPTSIGPGQQWIYQVDSAKVWVVKKSS